MTGPMASLAKMNGAAREDRKPGSGPYASGDAVEHVIAVSAMKSPTDNAFCRLLCRVMGRRADTGAPYATDGGQFQRLGIHSYICGPGLLAEAHQLDESLLIGHFFDGLEKVKEIVCEWCVHAV